MRTKMEIDEIDFEVSAEYDVVEGGIVEIHSVVNAATGEDVTELLSDEQLEALEYFLRADYEERMEIADAEQHYIACRRVPGGEYVE